MGKHKKKVEEQNELIIQKLDELIELQTQALSPPDDDDGGDPPD